MSEITVRVVGTVCYVEGGDAHPEFKKRLVMPADNSSDPRNKHIAYVEFPADGIVSGSSLSTKYQHPTNEGQIDYRRFDLSGHVVTIQNVVDEPFIVKQSFNDRVPKMTQVANTLDQAPRHECFEDPDPSIIAGIFDISSGTLKAGTLHEDVTHWKLKNAGTTVYNLRTAIFTELLIDITPPLTVTFNKGGSSIAVVLDETVDVITIGNQPLGDIVGGGSGDDVEHDFLLYYNLADPVNYPGDPPVPRAFALIVNACSDTQWP